jgi:fructokinase
MKNNEIFFFNDKISKPIATGTGLIALDVIINGHNKNEPYYMTGGSCGNVLIILSYFGWNTFPLGRFKEDNFSKFIINDLKKWGVDTTYLKIEDKASTPVIIEKVRQKENGGSTHAFSFFCPECNSFLPRYRPITRKQAVSILDNLPASYVCYIDRVSAGSLEYAKSCKDKGAIIFFEPTKIDENQNFSKILEICDILKYSNEICITDPKIVRDSDVPLKIETLGSSGLLFSFNNRLLRKGNKKWQKIKAFSIKDVVDAAGAGDWCSAGLIHFLNMKKIKDINQLDEKTLRTALNFGQALAAGNCKFFGARGSMYALSKEEFHKLINDILNNRDLSTSDMTTLKLKRPKKNKDRCPICNEKKRI